MLNKKNIHPNQTGATGIIIILIMIVLLTIGISIFTNTTRDVAITTQTEESTRVFHAAESGIENALSQIYEAEVAEIDTPEGNFTTGDDGEIIYSIAKKKVLDILVPVGETIEVPLTGLAASDQINILWSEKGEACPTDSAALLISIYSSSSPMIVQHYAVDGCDPRYTNNNFEFRSSDGGSNFEHRYDITLPANPSIARIQTLFNDTKMRIEGLQEVSQYGILSRSEAATAGDEAQSILVERTLPSAPSFMNYSLVSGTNINK